MHRLRTTTSGRKILQVPSGISCTSSKFLLKKKRKLWANYAPEQDKSFSFDCRWDPESTWSSEVLWCCTSCQLCPSVAWGHSRTRRTERLSSAGNNNLLQRSWIVCFAAVSWLEAVIEFLEWLWCNAREWKGPAKRALGENFVNRGSRVVTSFPRGANAVGCDTLEPDLLMTSHLHQLATGGGL